jgi:acetyltransferase-like isoleucine patch superfamily enzyme
MADGEQKPAVNLIENSDIGHSTDIHEFSVVKDCSIGNNTTIWRFTNIYGCHIGSDVMIGSLVEIQADVTIGHHSRIQSHAFVCSLVEIGNNVFVSHGAKFVNDVYPPSGDPNTWEKTTVHDGATIGTNATLLPVEVGENALVGAGAVVTDDVPANAIVAGNPAEIIGYRDD